MSSQGLSRDNVQTMIRDISTSKVGTLEKIEGNTARCVVDGQVIPARFVAGLGLTERLGEEVVITFIDKDLSDGIVTGIVTDIDTSGDGVSEDDFGLLVGRVSVNEGLISDNAGSISALDGRVGANESAISTNTGAISGLDGRVGIAEGLINTNAGDISGLDSRVTTAEGNITSLDTRLGTAESNITTLGTTKADDNTVVHTTGNESIAGLKTFTGATTTAKRLIATNSATATHGVISRGSRANMLYDNVGITGGIASALIDVDITNGSDKKARVGKVGIYGNATSGDDGYPKLNYMWFSAITDNTYNRDATLKVDSQNRVGIAIAGTSRPTQALDVNGKIRMRTQTASGDGADIVTTKGYVDSGLGSKADASALTSHINADNPHGITKSTVGLGKVDNTSDLEKPISTATATALGLKADVTALNTHTGKTDNPHSVTKSQVGLGNVDNVKQYSASNTPPYPVTKVAGKTGAVTLVKGDVGLDKVDNTSDLAKPISTATQTALNLKADTSALTSGLAEKLDLSGGTMTGMFKGEGGRVSIDGYGIKSTRPLTLYMAFGTGNDIRFRDIFDSRDYTHRIYPFYSSEKGYSLTTELDNERSLTIYKDKVTVGTEEHEVYHEGNLTADAIPILSADKITSGVLGVDRIPNLSAGKITSGTFDSARIPSLNASKITAGTFGTARIPSLSADKITSGTFATDRIPSLPASKITSGTFHVDRIPQIGMVKVDGLSGALDEKIDKPTWTSQTITNDGVVVDWSHTTMGEVTILRGFINPNTKTNFTIKLPFHISGTISFTPRSDNTTYWVDWSGGQTDTIPLHRDSDANRGCHITIIGER